MASPAVQTMWLSGALENVSGKARARVRLRLHAALTGRLVLVGDVYALVSTGGWTGRITIARLYDCRSAPMAAGRVTGRTQVYSIVGSSDGPGKHSALTSGTSSGPSSSSDCIFPAQRLGYTAICELLRSSLPPYASALRQCSVRRPSGALLSGPPGTGKTHLVRAAAAAAGSPLVAFSGGVQSVSCFRTSSCCGSRDDTHAKPWSLDGVGDTATRLRVSFALAAQLSLRTSAARCMSVSAILFLDEIDALCPKRSDPAISSRQVRNIAVLLTQLDGLRSHAGRVITLAATNRPLALEEAIRRPGRLEWEVPLRLPSAAEREAALCFSCCGLGLQPSLDLANVAHAACNGYAAADLIAIAREAALSAVRAHSIAIAGAAMEPGVAPTTAPVQMMLTELHAVDVMASLSRVSASLPRPSISAQAPIEPINWEAIGGTSAIKLRLRRAVEWPLTRTSAYTRLGIGVPRGVLLYGPPGCAKTSLARAAAGASGVSFYSLSGSALYSPYVGEAERQLRDFFALGRTCAPAILFLDELDAIVSNRGGTGSVDAVHLRVLSTLLNEMDGLATAAQIVVIGATNRVDVLDAALLRPGRFDELVNVPRPDSDSREQVLRTHTMSMPLAPTVRLDSLAAQCKEWTGAQLAGLCREAAMNALRENLCSARIEPKHFRLGACQ